MDILFTKSLKTEKEIVFISDVKLGNLKFRKGKQTVLKTTPDFATCIYVFIMLKISPEYLHKVA